MLHGEMMARMPASEMIEWQALQKARNDEVKKKPA